MTEHTTMRRAMQTMICRSNIFEDIKASVSIAQVVEHYGFVVNRAGKFACPFHNDTHPSASIKADYFHCFVCGAGGDVISFVARLFGLSNIDACKKIAADFGLNISAEPQSMKSLLMAERQAAERKRAQKEWERIRALTIRAGEILEDYHRYLMEGKTAFPFGHPRNTEALCKLDYAQYLIDCYEGDPEEFSKNNRKVVDDLERKLHRIYNENERISG